MIEFVYGDALASKPYLAHSMFKDRAEQFKHRLQWDVTVNTNGEELDAYDGLNPLYIIVTDGDGLHEASMRLLPSTGQTMVNDHFLHVTKGVRIESSAIWECTRFCVSPRAKRNAAAKLLAAGGKVMQECCIEHFVGVFDKKMLPVYRRLGSTPTIVGWSTGGDAEIGVGLWQYSGDAYQQMLSNCGMSHAEMELSFVNSGLYAGRETTLLTRAA